MRRGQSVNRFDEVATGRFSASATYTSTQENRVLLFGSIPSGRSDPALLPKASFAIEARSGWTATVYADNLSNFHGIIVPGYANLPLFYGRVYGRARPRTIGLQFEFHY